MALLNIECKIIKDKNQILRFIKNINQLLIIFRRTWKKKFNFKIKLENNEEKIHRMTYYCAIRVKWDLKAFGFPKFLLSE